MKLTLVSLRAELKAGIVANYVTSDHYATGKAGDSDRECGDLLSVNSADSSTTTATTRLDRIVITPKFSYKSMMQTSLKRLTFEEYLTYDDGTDNKYELVDGELVLMPPAVFKHDDIVNFLYIAFYLEIKRLGLDWVVRQGTIGVRTTTNKSRIPDICVINGEEWRQNSPDSPAVLETAPLLVVEVVSEGSIATDYRRKRTEYANREIPEYWIVDPIAAKVSVLLLDEGFYDVVEFIDNQKIVSKTFSELDLTAQQILTA
jgi:Uma2 family endonuclease